MYAYMYVCMYVLYDFLSVYFEIHLMSFNNQNKFNMEHNF